MATQPDSDGWIEWQGGDCPVDGDALVNWRVVVRDDDDDDEARPASELDWEHLPQCQYNIIAYRAVPV